MDFEESVRSSKVLQGQENVGFVSPLYGCDTVSHALDFEMRTPTHQSLALAGIRKDNVREFVRARPTTYTGFMESNRFPKVLQGQEICPLRSLTGKMDLNLGTWGKPNLGCNSFNMYQASKPSFYPLPSESLQNMFFPYGDMHKTSKNHAMRSYGTSFQRDNVQFNSSPIQAAVVGDEVRKVNLLSEHQPLESTLTPSLKTNIRNQKDGSFNGTAAGCKLFGFSLTGETPTPSAQSSGKRSCTKVSYISINFETNLPITNFYLFLILMISYAFGEGSQARQLGWKSY